MINWFNHLYPYTNLHELNLDWVIATVKQGEKDIADFIGINTIKYADPILWNIESQYEANTVVVDAQTGNAYISVKAVPSGVHLNRTEYWTQIYNYANVVDTLREQISFNEGDTTTASKPFMFNDLVFINGLLYRVIAPMIAGDSFIVDSNIVKTTVEAEIKRVADSLQPSITEIQNNIGNLATLDTTDKSTLVNAINEVLSSLSDTIGDLATLDTTDKSTLVNAINEVLLSLSDTIGDLATLDTTDKSTLVNAINEVLSSLSDTIGDYTIYNVKNFGATGDGNTNDTASIQNALNYVNDNGGVLWFPKGVYKITNTLNYYGDNLVLCGSLSSKILVSGNILGLDLYHADNIIIKNLSFENTTSSTKPIIDFCSRYGIIEGCVFDDKGRGCAVMIRNRDNKLLNCLVNHWNTNGGQAIRLDTLNGDDGVNWSINNLIDGCTIYSVTVGIAMVKGHNGHVEEGATITNNTIMGQMRINDELVYGSYGIYANAMFSCRISNNMIDSWTSNGILLNGDDDTTSNFKITENYISNGIAVNGQSDNTITSTIIDSNTLYSKGIGIDYASGVVISNNDINATEWGFYLSNHSKNTIIEGNTIRATNQIGLCYGGSNHLIKNNFATNVSLNGVYTVDNPAYIFDSAGHVTITHTTGWQVIYKDNYQIS